MHLVERVAVLARLCRESLHSVARVATGDDLLPEGWKAYATRGYNDRISDTYLEFEIATKRAKTKDILFVVYGGGQKVKKEAQQQGWVWIPETMDVKSGKEEALS
jgi:hypothetical protein